MRYHSFGSKCNTKLHVIDRRSETINKSLVGLTEYKQYLETNV